MASATFGIEYSVTVNGKVDPRYTLDSDINGSVSYVDFLQYIKEHIIIFSDIALREEQSKGFDKKPVRIVDNSHYKALGDVKPLGKVEYVARQNVNDILTGTFDSLFSQSPYVTGEYRRSHILFHNGVPIATSPEELNSWIQSDKAKNVEDNDIFRFVNVAPYARRLETLGVTSKRQQNRKVKARGAKKAGNAKVTRPNGAYYLTYRSVKRKFGKNVGIFFKLIAGSEFGNSSLSSVKFKSKANIGPKGARTYLYPSIKILVKTSGIL